MFGVETLAFALASIKCCWVAKCLEKLFYETRKHNLSGSDSVKMERAEYKLGPGGLWAFKIFKAQALSVII